ncbi:MAG: RluA family pseudouridine synthase [Gammaproteobacteria bacterium]|nr:RluA family pseudouridine synthase [Gammaproteobacteria bacterium]
MANVQLIQVGERAGQRLDNFLLGQLKGVPRSRVYRMIRSGEVRVNGSRRRPSSRLEFTDQVRIPPVRIGDRSEPAEAPHAWIKRVRNSVMHEDGDLIVLNKPVGVAVHGGSGEPFGIAETLEQVFGDANMQLAHRLDKATSGCLVIAKNRRTLEKYHSAFRNNEIKKTYDALVQGEWPKAKSVVDASIERFHLANGERRVRVSDSGQSSRTLFHVLAHCTEATWLSVRPQTGRTHQIRIHTQYAGHPILGDRKYGNRDFLPRAPRLMLHAQALDLPDLGEIVAPVPSELVSYWERLQRAD